MARATESGANEEKMAARHDQHSGQHLDGQAQGRPSKMEEFVQGIGLKWSERLMMIMILERYVGNLKPLHTNILIY